MVLNEGIKRLVNVRTANTVETAYARARVPRHVARFVSTNEKWRKNVGRKEAAM